jgi:hypothetical protein
MRALTDLRKFTSVLPYASEMFGVYTPLLGWRSQRQRERLTKDALGAVAGRFRPEVFDPWNHDGWPQDGEIRPGVPAEFFAAPRNDSLVVDAIGEAIRQEWGPDQRPRSPEEWRGVLDPARVEEILRTVVRRQWIAQTSAQMDRLYKTWDHDVDGDTDKLLLAAERLRQSALEVLERESAIAGALVKLGDDGNTALLDRTFYLPYEFGPGTVTAAIAAASEDPFLTFDPYRDASSVSVSPLGIVNLFRQYFFEFDTFLGTPVGHVWLTPGSSVELLEVSTRKVTVEKSVETEYESVTRVERETTEQDELSEAVKKSNQDDMKLGFSTTVRQSWGSGSAEASGSINLDQTQASSREQTHKRMRQQTEKLSSEIREKYKTTFKTVTESSDTSSKRYLLANTTDELLNYEMRRKMRQVGVQVQDVGSYLCWQTFVDEPGATLGLADLVHIAQPADLAPLPNQKEIPYPPRRIVKSFQVQTVWSFPDVRQHNDPNLGFVYLGEYALPVQPDPGYEIERPPGDVIHLGVSNFVGEDAGRPWAMGGRLSGDTKVIVGVKTGPGGLKWDQRVDITVTGEIAFVLSAAKVAEIDAANAEIVANREAATREQEREIRKAFLDAARERITQASVIRSRPFEDLREEERTAVYRALIRDLMTAGNYSAADDRTRHVLSELINSVFDIDKMLYFVAPEWWKPRAHRGQYLGGAGVGADVLVNWSGSETRQNNYLITDGSEPAELGASLGWLLQLDGDRHRNAFLNAPWVKAVIPVRPGKERAAMNWLQRANIEGSEGLDARYSAPEEDLALIRAELLAADPGDPVEDPPTIGDAIRHLCLVVEKKHAESVAVSTYPDGPGVSQDDQVSATPVERVFEHGFYPLQGGFRVDPKNPDPNNPSPNYQVFDQWIEILPTDQVVPVAVAYDPLTGQQR